MLKAEHFSLNVRKLPIFIGLVIAAIGCGGTNAASVGSPSYGGDILNNQQTQQVVNNATKALNEGDAPKLTASLNGFGFDLFRRVAAQTPKENVCVSPVSVSSVLAMLYNGSAGDTQKQIGQTLKAAKFTPDQINDAAKNLTAIFSNLDPDKVQLENTNSLWVNSGVTLSPDFVAKNETNLGAKVTTLDFHSADAPKTINDWVSEKTKGKIPTIVEKVPEDARLYVINTVYFKGKWSQPFRKELTEDRDFTLADGTKERVPTMSQTDSLGYFTNGDAVGVALPYGSGRLEMVIFMPGGKNDLTTLEKKLDANNWSAWMKTVKKQRVELTMPKFHTDFAADLNGALKSAGMADAFDPVKANFTNIEAKNATTKPEKLYLSDVKHKVSVDVNEEGTEAASATSGQVSATAIMLPTKFTVDHPFLYAIRDTQTGAVLFFGAMLDPKASAPTADAPAKASNVKP